MTETSKVPIDRGWAWMAMIGTSICMFFVVGMFRSQGILFVEFINIFGSSYAMSSWMVGVTSCGMSLFSPVANHLAVRFTSRRVVMAGSLLCATAAFATAWAPNINFVICIFGGMTGVGYACMFGPSLTIIGLYFEKRRSLANGLALAGASVGCLVLPPMMALIIQHYTVWGGLIIYSAFILNGLVAAMLLRPMRFYKRNVTVKSSAIIPPDTVPVMNVQKDNDKSYSLSKSMNDLSTRRNISTQLGGSEAMLNLPQGQAKLSVISNGTEKKSQGTAALETPNSVCVQSYICARCQVQSVLISGVQVCPQCNECQSISENVHPKSPVVHLKSKNLLLRIDDHYTSKESLFIAEGQDIPDEMIQEELKLQRQSNHKIRSHDALHTPCNQKSNHLLTSSSTEHSEIKNSVCSKLKEYLHLLNLDLFTNSLFIIYTVSCSLGNSSYVDHFVILPPHAQDLGISKSQAALILSLAGAADLFARVIGGWFADLNLIKRSTLMSIAVVMTGVSTSICSFFPSYASLVATMVVLGAVSGVQIAVFSVVLIDFLGLVKFPSAFGLFLMVQGLFNTAYPPFLGWLKDLTGSYSYSFLTLGLAMILSGMVLWFEPCAREHEERKRTHREDTEA